MGWPVRLLVVCVLIACAPLPMAAQDSSPQVPDPLLETSTSGQFSTAATMLDEWGNRGIVYPRDDGTANGVGCYHIVGNSTGAVDVAVRGPEVGAYYSVGQWVGWLARLYQWNPDGTLTLLSTSSEYQAFVQYQNFPTKFSDISFQNLPQGPIYLVSVEIGWYWYGVLDGYRHYGIDFYGEIVNERVAGQYDACYPVFPAGAAIHSSRGTVNSNVLLTGAFFPLWYPATVYWGSKSLGTLTTTDGGTFSVRFKVPAIPMGTYPVYVNAGGAYNTIAGYYTVVPRIKVIEGTVARGQTVNISLRGYAAREVVRIRWRKLSGTWVEIARVTTSSTGSANVYVAVPSWAPDGPASVRGDGTYGRAQTNAVYVSGGSSLTLASEASPSPTTTASPTETATSTAPIDSSSPTATITKTPTATESPTTSPTANPTESPTETVTPTETVEPTQTATETVTSEPPEEMTVTPDQ